MIQPKILKIKATPSSPSILLDGVNGLIEFPGKSLSTNTREFYNPVFDWIAEYLQKPQPKTVLIYRMDAITTSFIKLFFDITMDIATTLGNTYKFELHWRYEKGDEVEMEFGQDFKSVLNKRGLLLNPADFKFVED